MPENRIYLPEGLRPQASVSLSELRAAAQSGAVLEGTAVRCDAAGALHVSLGTLEGVLPREQIFSPWVSGSGRNIAVLALVGRAVCFTVTGVEADSRGAPRILLSRRAAQERALAWALDALVPGVVVTARVTHLEPFGAFVDIGCGIIALLPTERISVSRIARPDERLHPLIFSQ
jgi:small subunit ribosomal protein S1